MERLYLLLKPMAEINFQIQWPDGTQQNCYSPSLVVKQYFSPGETYELTEFVEKSRTALNIEERSREKGLWFFLQSSLRTIETDRI